MHVITLQDLVFVSFQTLFIAQFFTDLPSMYPGSVVCVIIIYVSLCDGSFLAELNLLRLVTYVL